METYTFCSGWGGIWSWRAHIFGVQLSWRGMCLELILSFQVAETHQTSSCPDPYSMTSWWSRVLKNADKVTSMSHVGVIALASFGDSEAATKRMAVVGQKRCVDRISTWPEWVSQICLESLGRWSDPSDKKGPPAENFSKLLDMVESRLRLLSCFNSNFSCYWFIWASSSCEVSCFLTCGMIVLGAIF